MRNLARWLCVVCAMTLLPSLAFAVDIDLRQSNGSKTTLGGVGDAAKVTIVSGSGGEVGSAGCWSTAAAPTYVEAVVNYLSCTLTGALRVTLETLIAGEDILNNLLMVSGGAVRASYLLGSVAGPATATDGTSTAVALPVGMKTFQGVVSCTGTCVQTQEIRGGWTSTYAAGDTVKVCTITLSGTTKTSDWCSTDRSFKYWFVVTTLTGGTTPLSLLAVSY